MKNSKKLFVLAAVMVAFLVGNAYAIPTLPGGPFTIKIENYEYFNPSLQPSPDGTGSGIGDGLEDNYGIATVTTISSGIQTTTQHWSRGDDGGRYQLFAVFGGLDVTNWTSLSSSVSNFSTGAATDVAPYFDLYLVDENVAGTLSWTDIANQGTGGVIAGGYNGISNAPGAILVAGGAFVSGIDSTDGNILTDGTLTNSSNPPTGKGSGYVDVTTGTWDSQILPYWTTAFGKRDLKITFDVQPPDPSVNDWSLFSNDPIQGAAVPEPGTIFLFGAGLIGLAFIGRKKFSIK
jgi:hypothetical protein